MQRKKLRIATRQSRLALWQAEHVATLLNAAGHDCELVPMTTKGDRILDRTLSKIGGKGLFIKELEQALQNGQADLAVHSLKDVPMDLPDGFALPCVLPRANVHDAFVSSGCDALHALPPGAIVGTASLRRTAILQALRPDVQIRPLRGNLDTRLAKLDAGEFDAVILAAIGLQRLGMQQRVRHEIPVETMLPAAGQGGLAIETLADNTELAAILQPLHHAASHVTAAAERAVSRSMQGGCSVPLAAYAVLDAESNGNGGQLHLRAAWGEADGSGGYTLLHATATATLNGLSHTEQVVRARELGQEAAQQLKDQGATLIAQT